MEESYYLSINIDNLDLTQAQIIHKKLVQSELLAGLDVHVSYGKSFEMTEGVTK